MFWSVSLSLSLISLPYKRVDTSQTYTVLNVKLYINCTVLYDWMYTVLYTELYTVQYTVKYTVLYTVLYLFV